MSGATIAGRAWLFGDDINTDLILPNRAQYLPVAEQVTFVFVANRPGWLDQVAPGDIVVGGRNFGMGSSRPAARSLKALGIGALVAESINGLFFRNAVNWGFPALACPGIAAAVAEGDRLEIALERAEVRNATRGTALVGRPIPAPLLALMRAGGIFPLLAAEGLIAAP